MLGGALFAVTVFIVLAIIGFASGYNTRLNMRACKELCAPRAATWKQGECECAP